MMRALHAMAVAILLTLAACGSDDGSTALDAGIDMAVMICSPGERTCGADDHCGGPCQPDKSGCTNHACFEPFTCMCNGTTMVCHFPNGSSCDMVPFPMLDMATRD